ncbi:MAG: HIT domain-containing protein [Chloroflexi bacterium]|nr:HIT domain-containing protein [Chloroflexota bacterium]
MGQDRNCVFCRIIAGEEPGAIRYQDNSVVVIENILHWAPVMLLVLPRRHVSQQEMWQDVGLVGQVAIEIGRKFCPNGFRVLSNFGPDAMQSQEHGHLHIIGGTFLGPYA